VPAEGSIVAKNGDTLKLKSLWDSSGYGVVADFSQADSALSTKEVKAKDNGDGSYGIEYKISDLNSQADGSKVIRLSATDSAGNKSTVDAITLILDNTPPKISKALVERAKYKNGDVVKIDLTADAPKYKVSASFKEVDSNYAPGLEKVEDQGGGNYKVEYRISAGNTIKDGTFVVLISASDGANTSLEKQELTLDNTPPEFKSISRLDSPTGVYSNTQSIKLTVELEASGQALAADFSDVDSEYSKGKELITDNGDATYSLEYRISAKNTKGDAPRLRIRLTASDDVGNIATKDFFVGLDSTAPGLKIDSPKDGDKLSSPKVVIKGKVDEPKAKLTINAQEVKYDQESGQFSYEISLNFGENEVKIEAIDLAGNLKSVTLKVHFSPEVSIVLGGEIILPEAKDDGIADNDTRIKVPAAALPEKVGDGSIFIESLENFNVPKDRLALATYSFRFKDKSEKEIKDLVFKKPVTLTLQFPALKEIDKKSNLKVFRWDGVRWREVGGKVDFEKRTITVLVDRFSEYAIFTAPRAGEKLPFEIVAPLLTPNGDGINDAVTFKILQDGKTTIRIYDKRGVLVKKLENGLATWDGRDEFGDLVEVGIYIYQVKTETEVKSGTIAVAR
jgi:gliding motility-associated-like protein